MELQDICFYVKERIKVSELNEHTYISTENMLPNKSGITTATNLPNTETTSAFKKGDILVSNIRPYFKKIWQASFDGGCSGDVLVFRTKQGFSQNFLHYVLANDAFFDYSMKSSKGTKMPRGDKESIMKYFVPNFTLQIQEKIAQILFSLDSKIETNNQINNNLEKQVMAVYKHNFIETENVDRKQCRADEYFNITIGKTPPRKEPEWFSTDKSNVKWVSISDMGSCGLYISDSSEYLTLEAIKKHNVKVVPNNTILLSFKLTVGRVAITDGIMTTNEAIAHFNTDNSSIKEYLYCYLKNFNYQTMGSTSSIAIAVNSKIIKAMPFILPTNNELENFHKYAEPIFSLIKNNQRENKHLIQLRDSILPKLMSGELDVSELDI